MASGGFRFDRFLLDPTDRLLRCDDRPVELSARYFDALSLLVSEQGRLVSKTRFLEEVWRGVPVTDEALTQCIKTLRRQLGDSAARPLFIETVPKHGYRFIAPVTCIDGEAPLADPPVANAPTEVGGAGPWRAVLTLGFAGTLGGGLAGIIGGAFYGAAIVSAASQAGGGASALLVMVCLTTLIGLIGGAGVSFGMAAAALAPARPAVWAIVGAALGGLLVGAIVKLIGLDALSLLFGRAPDGITGGLEGACLGTAIGVGTWLAGRGGGDRSPAKAAAAAGLATGLAGSLIAMSGGRLLGGSLELLARAFPDSRLQLGQIGRLFGETGLGPISQIVTAGLEGALFGGCVAAAMFVARRGLDGKISTELDRRRR